MQPYTGISQKREYPFALRLVREEKTNDGKSPGTNRGRFVPANMLCILPVSARETHAASPRDRRLGQRKKGYREGTPIREFRLWRISSRPAPGEQALRSSGGGCEPDSPTSPLYGGSVRACLMLASSRSTKKGVPRGHPFFRWWR